MTTCCDLAKKTALLLIALLFSTLALSAEPRAEDAAYTSHVETIFNGMTQNQRIAQKIMMDFRYWCEAGSPACITPMTELPSTLKSFLADNALGGVILFQENITDIDQAKTLTSDLQAAMVDHPGLLIGIDQEGGNIVRLPRAESASFSGNMAIAAASINKAQSRLAYQVGQALAEQLQDIGVNIDFAPVVDVNSNPLNPVINVRAFSDSPQLVAEYGNAMLNGFHSRGIMSSLKHFPGHGNTELDSHFALPIVESDRATAEAIDLYPFKTIIQNNKPDLIMTAHIQYPALDDSMVVSDITGEYLYVPATLSHTIQTKLLREELGFQGLSITDALDMQGISNFFTHQKALIEAFKAGVDIGLMPIYVHQPGHILAFNQLINEVADAIERGEIDEAAFNHSVKRILQVKLSRGLITTSENQEFASSEVRHKEQNLDKAHRRLERKLADQSVTLVENNGAVPLRLGADTRIHVLMPWSEQGEAIAHEIANLKAQGLIDPDVTVTYTRMADGDIPGEQENIDAADIFITGLMSTSPYFEGEQRSFISELEKTTLLLQSASIVQSTQVLSADGLSDFEFAKSLLAYAQDEDKDTIYVSLRAPYDLAYFADKADATLATYSYYGYQHGIQRGPSLLALTRLLTGEIESKGRLPVEVYHLTAEGSLGHLAYPRGYGL
ncbi:MAG: glycoside hydrolase family 3 protein [Pseudomonadota bacterium]